jgi:tight adherence protein B
MNIYLVFIMVAVAIGGVAWVFIYPFLSGERAAELRVASVARTEPVAQRPTRSAQKTRREQVEGSLKQIEARKKTAKRVPLSIRLTRVGLNWSPRRFLMTAGALGLVVFVVAISVGGACCPALVWRSRPAADFPSGFCPFSKNGANSASSHRFPTPST